MSIETVLVVTEYYHDCEMYEYTECYHNIAVTATKDLADLFISKRRDELINIAKESRACVDENQMETEGGKNAILIHGCYCNQRIMDHDLEGYYAWTIKEFPILKEP